MPEIGPQIDPRLELLDDAVSIAKEGLRTMIEARKPEVPVTEDEKAGVDALVGLAVSAGFHKGRWLDGVEHSGLEPRMRSGADATGYPT
jgi:hypothetical protein